MLEHPFSLKSQLSLSHTHTHTLCLSLSLTLYLSFPFSFLLLKRVEKNIFGWPNLDTGEEGKVSMTHFPRIHRYSCRVLKCCFSSSRRFKKYVWCWLFDRFDVLISIYFFAAKMLFCIGWGNCRRCFDEFSGQLRCLEEEGGRGERWGDRESRRVPREIQWASLVAKSKRLCYFFVVVSCSRIWARAAKKKRKTYHPKFSSCFASVLLPVFEFRIEKKN